MARRRRRLAPLRFSLPAVDVEAADAQHFALEVGEKTCGYHRLGT